MSTHAPSFSSTPSAQGYRIAVVSTDWNARITDPLRDSCVARLKELGVKDDDIECYRVPGAIELTFAASKLIETSTFDCIVVIGCVIRGGTPHFDYVCQSVTRGITNLNADCDIPVIFGVLTVDNEQQAIDRLSKGPEYASTAVQMVVFNKMTEDL